MGAEVMEEIANTVLLSFVGVCGKFLLQGREA